MFSHKIASTALIPVNLVFNLTITVHFLPALLALPFSEDFIMKLKLFLWPCMSVPEVKRMQNASVLQRRNFGSHFAEVNFLQLPEVLKRWALASLGKKPILLNISFSIFYLEQVHTCTHTNKKTQTQTVKKPNIHTYIFLMGLTMR